MTVVLGPGWPGVLLHEAIGHGLEGDFNRKGSPSGFGRQCTGTPARRRKVLAPWRRLIATLIVAPRLAFGPCGSDCSLPSSA
ncbi:MAG: TldD protein, part of TldE/TldD proteolytic complex [Candidatus Burkholderia crenata]|nr:MAG: TldD protein, part of TldE/TldD proteolytic complex [Candidatus Burkholderia crenata]